MIVVAAIFRTGWRLLTRLVAPLVALALLAGFAAFKLSDVPLVSVCGGSSVVSSGSNVLAGPAHWLRALGRTVGTLATDPDVYASPDAVRENVEGTADVLGVWWRSFVGAVRGEPEDPLVKRLAEEAQDQAVASVRSCLPCPTGSTGGLLGAPSSTSVASDETVATAGSSKDVARAAIVAAGFPASEVPTAMGVVGAESSYRPRALLHYGGTTMDGLFQMNRRAHPEFAGQNLFDPAANARAAYRVWVAAGKRWTPWSTYNSGAYRSFMSAADQSATAAIPGAPAAPLLPGLGKTLAGCAGAGTGGPTGGVITWNTYVRNSDRDVLHGLEAMRRSASVICLQEVSSTIRRAAIRGDMPGWAMVGERTSQPCVYDTSKERLVAQSAKVSIPGDQRMDPRADGQRTNGTRWVVSATFDEVGTGVRWSVVNTHQIPTIHEGNRMRFARQLVSDVAAKVRELSPLGAVVQTGDMNDTGESAGDLTQVGLVDTSSVLGTLATLRARDIDKVRTTGATPVSQRLLPRFGSDHAPRLVVFAPATQNVVDATGTGAQAGVASGVRVVRDPSSGVSYTVRMPSDPRRVKAIDFAIRQLGKPYVWGAKGPDSYDCSGLMHAAWAAAGVDVYPQTETLVRQFVHVSEGQPGDLLYHPGHVQMLLGSQGGKQIILEAPRPGRDVMIRPQWGTVTAVLDPTQKVA